VNLSGLTADQQFQAGLVCNGSAQHQRLPAVVVSGIAIFLKPGENPAPGTENDDKNPPRIAPRHVFDLAIGHDNVFRGDKYKVSIQVTALNLTNTYALYNFLSTFSGTHYLTPRTLTVQLGFHF
jgi:hypothetical protein